jgi:hypothetical protein
MEMLINVTQEDIDKGCQRNSSNCPVARAIKRQTGQDVLVGAYQFGLMSGEKLWMPQGVQNFVYAFDNGYNVLTKPFSFYLPDTIMDNCGSEECEPAEPKSPEKDRELVYA